MRGFVFMLPVQFEEILQQGFLYTAQRVRGPFLLQADITNIRKMTIDGLNSVVTIRLDDFRQVSAPVVCCLQSEKQSTWFRGNILKK